MKICAVGGDGRIPFALAALKRRGHEVSHTAYDAPLSAELLGAGEAILLPYPATRDGLTLNAPTSPLPIPLGALGSMLPEGVPVLAGRVTEALRAVMGDHPLYDYEREESFLLKNAAITAEGALSLIMQRLPSPLADVPCLVLGSGRLASALADLLLGLHAPLTVAARNAAARLPGGLRPLPLAALPAELARFGVILNTVPVPLLTPRLLSRASEGTLLLELSAVPGVIESEACHAAGIELLTAPGLPGRYAPKGAGEALAEAVDTILRNSL